MNKTTDKLRTKFIHTNGSNEYSQERKKLHLKIINLFFREG